MEKLYISTHLGHHFETGGENPNTFRVIHRDGNYLTVLYKDKISKIQILEENFRERYYKLLIDGVSIQFQIETELDVRIREMGMEKVGSSKIDKIEAPMPGLVLDILVELGKEVEEGEPLLILEAMKMENVIKAPAAGIIEEIFIKKGASVEKKALLIKMA